MLYTNKQGKREMYTTSLTNGLQWNGVPGTSVMPVNLMWNAAPKLKLNLWNGGLCSKTWNP